MNSHEGFFISAIYAVPRYEMRFAFEMEESEGLKDARGVHPNHLLHLINNTITPLFTKAIANRNLKAM